MNSFVIVGFRMPDEIDRDRPFAVWPRIERPIHVSNRVEATVGIVVVIAKEGGMHAVFLKGCNRSYRYRSRSAVKNRQSAAVVVTDLIGDIYRILRDDQIQQRLTIRIDQALRNLVTTGRRMVVGRIPLPRSAGWSYSEHPRNYPPPARRRHGSVTTVLVLDGLNSNEVKRRIICFAQCFSGPTGIQIGPPTLNPKAMRAAMVSGFLLIIEVGISVQAFILWNQ